MFVWHPSEGTGHSIKPHPGHHENPGVLLRSTKKKLAARSKPTENHELMSEGCHILRGSQICSSGLETLTLLIRKPDAIQQDLLNSPNATSCIGGSGGYSGE
ncbi:hypothetical protein NQZ68_001878 [Dissostichus eleginoides]|nr:hypothetical protein NQZ68_001878 [Dissostichus eleginoides]